MVESSTTPVFSAVGKGKKDVCSCLEKEKKVGKAPFYRKRTVHRPKIAKTMSPDWGHEEKGGKKQC